MNDFNSQDQELCLSEHYFDPPDQLPSMFDFYIHLPSLIKLIQSHLHSKQVDYDHRLQPKVMLLSFLARREHQRGQLCNMRRCFEELKSLCEGV